MNDLTNEIQRVITSHERFMLLLRRAEAYRAKKSILDRHTINSKTNSVKNEKKGIETSSLNRCFMFASGKDHDCGREYLEICEICQYIKPTK